MTPSGLFVGLTTIDIQYLVDGFPESDEKVAARAFVMSTGGPAANAAVAFAHLGGRSRLLTRIGNHILSQYMTDELARCGVEVIDIAPDSPSLPIVSSVVSIPESGHRAIVTYRPAIRYQVDSELLTPALHGVDIVLVDGHHVNVGIAVASEARRRHLPVVLDGGSWRDGMEELIPLVDVAIAAETFRPPGTHTAADMFDQLAAWGIENRAVSSGNGPILCHARGEVSLISIEPVEVVDTSGAGDILHGAFCYVYAQGGRFTEALEQASRVATKSCQSFGTRAWMRETSTE